MGEKQLVQRRVGGGAPPARTQGLAFLESVGLRGENLERFCRLVDNTGEGILLITGSGQAERLAVLYAVIRWLRSKAVKLVTLEEDASGKGYGGGGSTFANVLRPALRKKPDVIVLEELRDSQTAKLAMMAVLRGCVVLSTVEAGGALGAVDRLADIGVEPCLIARAVRGVVSQRMVRRLCPHCRRPYTPSLDELAELGVSPGDYLFYQDAGCSRCSNGGYGGSAGVFEVLAVTPEVRQAIQGQSRPELERALEQPRGRSIADGCRRLVLEGETSVQEIRRVLGDG